jgi:hypothetical protein
VDGFGIIKMTTNKNLRILKTAAHGCSMFPNVQVSDTRDNDSSNAA